MYEGKMLPELDSLQARAAKVLVSEEVVDGIQDVRNMLAFEVLGSESEYTREIAVGDKIVALDVPAGMPIEEVEALLGKFVRDVRAALDAMLEPSTPSEPKAEKVNTKLSPEDVRYIEKLIDDEYQEALDTVNLTLDAARHEVAPDIDAVKAAVLKTLTHELVAELKHLREPTLLIVPHTNGDRLLAAANRPECINQGGTTGQENAYWNADAYAGAVAGVAEMNNVAANQEKITSYRFVITEGKQHFDARPKDADVAWNARTPVKNGVRIKKFQEYCTRTGMKSLDASAFVLLMIRGMRKGEPTDRISDTDFNFTLLPGDPLDKHMKGDSVATGYWYSHNRQARFSYDSLGPGLGNARLRAAVMGNIETPAAPKAQSNPNYIEERTKEVTVNGVRIVVKSDGRRIYDLYLPDVNINILRIGLRNRPGMADPGDGHIDVSSNPYGYDGGLEMAKRLAAQGRNPESIWIHVWDSFR